MSGEVSVEATGETVGEAKWAAIRELEALLPGVARDEISLQVVTEGERGLLGVGFTPARVVASARADAAATAAEPLSPGSQAAEVRDLLELAATAIGIPVRVTIDEAEDEITATVAGTETGVLIGRHGQTLDALQYLANAVSRISGGDDRKHVTVDAGGYRSRRTATVTAVARRAAERAAASGRPVSLEPMTAVDRKIVHEALKDDPEVETSSDGLEPNRFVVVSPTGTAV